MKDISRGFLMIFKKAVNQRLDLASSLSIIKSQQILQTKKSRAYNITSLLTNSFYQFSHKKMSFKKKSLKENQSYINSQSSNDFNSLPKNQQLKILNQAIHELIDHKQDDANLIETLESFSNFMISQNKLKDGMIQFNSIANKMRSIPVFKASPNLHFVLCELRYYLIRTGRIQQAISISEQSLRLLKKGSNKQSLHLANQYGSLGVIHFMNRNLAEARRYLQNQDKINEKICDPTYIQYIDCKNNLAIIDFFEGKYEEAQKVFQKNAHISKRILKSTKKGKQTLYIKHLAYLQAIYQITLIQSTSEQQKQICKKNIIQSIDGIRQILKDNNNSANDLFLYYETIAEHFLNKKSQLSVKFIKKAIQINFKKLDQPQAVGKGNRTSYEFSTIISKDLKLLGQAYQRQNKFRQAQETYLKSINQYKKDILSPPAKQMFSLQNLQNFVQCCRSLFYLQFLPENSLRQPLEQAIKYMQEPLLVWSEIVKNIWNLPARFMFVPYELNIEIGIKLLQNGLIEAGLEYFSRCTREIANNKKLLCVHSKSKIRVLAQVIDKDLQKIDKSSEENLISLKKVYQQLISLSQT